MDGFHSLYCCVLYFFYKGAIWDFYNQAQTSWVCYFLRNKRVSGAGVAVCLGSWTLRKERLAQRKGVAWKDHLIRSHLNLFPHLSGGSPPPAGVTPRSHQSVTAAALGGQAGPGRPLEAESPVTGAQ